MAEPIDAIRGWGITRVKVPGFRLLGPWERLGSGEARPQSRMFLTETEAEAAREGGYEFWEVAAVYGDQTEVYRNYETNTPATLIDVSLEEDAAVHGLGVQWISPSWAVATQLGT